RPFPSKDTKGADSMHKMLVIGTGSIGERHVRCLLNTSRATVGICEINDKLRGEVQALEAWQNVAAESNRDVSAYLQEKFPSLELDGGWPVSNIRKAIEHLETSELSGSEALYGFCGWLTTRDEAVTFSGHHNAGVAADLVALFCEVNDLAEPCDHWDKNLVHPKECRPDESKIIMEKVSEEDRPRLEDQFPSSWRSHLERILSKLSGDLSQDNVAAAKEILKNLLE
ncbi:hypothetical protein LCGC14_2928390, partial [marine sediment metagenome]